MKRLAPFLVLLAGILWGMIGIFVRRLNLMGISSMEIVTVRAFTTSVLLLVFLLFYDRKLLVIRLRDLWCFVGTGIISIVFFNYCYFRAINETSLAVAAVLLYTAPTIVMLLSAVLFRERITIRKLVIIAVTFAGCILVTGVLFGFPSLSAGGVLVGLGAGLGYALYSIFSRYALQRGYHSLTISFYTFLFAFCVTVWVVDLREISDACMGGFGDIVFCFIFGLISTVIPYIVYTLGLGEMENSKASILASVEPVTATLLGVVFYQEKLTVYELAGAVLILGAIVASNIHTDKRGRMPYEDRTDS